MLVVRPPDYFPPVAHAALAARASTVVLADTFAFSRQATHNRTRIGTSQGPLWLSVPRRHVPIGTPLNRVGVVLDGWERRHVRALRSAYGMAPYLDWLLPGVEALLSETYETIGALGVATTRWTLGRLGVAADVQTASALPGAPASLADVWEAMGKPDVLTLPETVDRDRAALEPLGATVHILRFDETPRRQLWPGADGGFVSGLSALDLLMAYGPDAGSLLGADAARPGRTSQSD